MSQSSARASFVNANTACDRPITTTCGCGSIGSMKISNAPSLSHAIGTVTMPSADRRSSSSGRPRNTRPRPTVDQRLLRLAHNGRLRARAAEPAFDGSVGSNDRLRSDVPRRRRPSPHHRGQRERLPSRRERNRTGEGVGVHVSRSPPGSRPTPDREAAACRCCGRRDARARRPLRSRTRPASRQWPIPRRPWRRSGDAATART